MPYFYVNANAQANGDHEVHQKDADCGHEPEPKNREGLGWHANCHGAVAEAKKRYLQSNGCYYCCNDCHTG
ncbi:hypothetical protein [Parasphingopyxis marina]|uniref:Uncharacterized protein n=1 Tax=Parasphingopyxis marina TaxID=2761622 RepID=A0A842HWX7_9SPHN|nr:hypothetical protein [Parasphingopyxis marina]MBC2776450.1 hypothetical protein [Parasphingopyxis marina]